MWDHAVLPATQAKPVLDLVTQEECKAELTQQGGNVTSARWQVTLCDPIWLGSSRSGEAGCKLLYSVYVLTNLQALEARNASE